MQTEASFSIEINDATATEFAKISGDWNPLHTDTAYAEKTEYGQTILHGAFSAGLVSRMAGMFIPGRDCLLHGMRLRFISPVLPPASLIVSGRLERGSEVGGSVAVTITDATDGRRYVEALYEFGIHNAPSAESDSPQINCDDDAPAVRYLVVGARGAMGRAVMTQLGPAACALSRTTGDGYLTLKDASKLGPIKGIVHCGWPQPDNTGLTRIDDISGTVMHHVASPLIEMIQCAQVLKDLGETGASLILVGSSFAEPGRHNFTTPLYSLAKSMIPNLTKILALELGNTKQRCIGLVFDVLEGGMNKGMSPLVMQTHADRNPFGVLGTPEQAAEQVAWVLDNTSHLVSGAVVSLTGAALP